MNLQAEFVAFATMADGTRRNGYSWKVSNFSAGDIDEDGLFESVDTNGGITDVIAQSFGVEGSAGHSYLHGRRDGKRVPETGKF